MQQTISQNRNDIHFKEPGVRPIKQVRPAIKYTRQPIVENGSIMFFIKPTDPKNIATIALHIRKNFSLSYLKSSTPILV